MSDISYPRLLSFTLDDWTVLGGRVSLTLTDKVGVIVGRNGAGKSAILEGLKAISSVAIGRFRRIRQNDEDSIPRILDISILTPHNRQLNYSYELLPSSVAKESLDTDDSDSDSVEEIEEEFYSWNDQCKYADGQKELLWTTEVGVTTLYSKNHETNTMILGSTNSVGRIGLRKAQMNLPDEMEWIFAVLEGIHILGKVPVRPTSKRRPSYLSKSRVGSFRIGFGLADNLSRKILRRMEREELEELESVCRRIGIGNEIKIQKFVLSSDARGENRFEDEEEYVSSVLLDGTNLGLLSDGTLRVLSILIEIMSSSPSATIIIEEPELQIHPGLLSKLLREIKAYTFDNNLIISTHSPQVASWTEPGKINLVYRNNKQTSVRKLGQDEINNIVEYLNEEGELGEWLYSGILDE